MEHLPRYILENILSMLDGESLHRLSWVSHKLRKRAIEYSDSLPPDLVDIVRNDQSLVMYRLIGRFPNLEGCISADDHQSMNKAIRARCKEDPVVAIFNIIRKKIEHSSRNVYALGNVVYNSRPWFFKRYARFFQLPIPSREHIINMIDRKYMLEACAQGDLPVINSTATMIQEVSFILRVISTIPVADESAYSQCKCNHTRVPLSMCSEKLALIETLSSRRVDIALKYLSIMCFGNTIIREMISPQSRLTEEEAGALVKGVLDCEHADTELDNLSRMIIGARECRHQLILLISSLKCLDDRSLDIIDGIGRLLGEEKWDVARDIINSLVGEKHSIVGATTEPLLSDRKDLVDFLLAQPRWLVSSFFKSRFISINWPYDGHWEKEPTRTPENVAQIIEFLNANDRRDTAIIFEKRMRKTWKSSKTPKNGPNSSQ